MNLNEIRLEDLDLSNIGAWPMAAKGVLVGTAFVLVVVGIWYFDISPQRKEWRAGQAKETELRNTYEGKQQRAANLPILKKQLAQMKESFSGLLRQLPDEAEIASLLTEISQSGLAVGLEFELFKPLAENEVEFYAELPIEIRVLGDYHQFGTFVSDISALPRLVTTHDIQINASQGPAASLKMAMVAKTYRARAKEE